MGLIKVNLDGEWRKHLAAFMELVLNMKNGDREVETLIRQLGHEAQFKIIEVEEESGG